MTTADQTAPVIPLPGFRQPTRARLDPEPDPETTTVMDPSPDPTPGPMTTERPSRSGRGAGLLGSGTPRPAPDDTRTGTSAGTGDPPRVDGRAAARLIAGLLGAVAVVAATVVGWRRGARLRRPTKGQLDDIAAPLARIATRHVPAHLLHEDLADAVLAASATGAYLADGPFIAWQTPADGDLPNYQSEEYA